MSEVSIGKAPDDKSCTTQLFPSGPPTLEWLPEQLMAYVQAQHQVILANECMLAVVYWRLGKALDALRKTFNHGQWEHFLKEASLHKSKVSRARAIAKAFASEEQLAGMTVREAYARRPRKDRPPTTPAASGNQAHSDQFARFLEHVDRLAEPFIDDAGFARADQAAALLPSVEQVIAKFDKIRVLLLERLGRS